MSILEDLLAGLREVCAAFPDKRSGGRAVYTMADIGLSAFSLFFMQSESFLAYQRSLEEGHKTSNCQTLFGMAKIPTDNHIRSLLDSVNPTHLQSAFDRVLDVFQRHGGLSTFHVLGRRTLIALDGTEYFCSQNLGCPCCQTRQRSNGQTERYHSMLAATLVAPGHSQVLPLMPEFITPQDGHDKQDCERAAAKRWLEAHAVRVQDLGPIYLGDDLFACQPIAEAMLQTGADFIFVCKPESHKGLYDFIDGAPRREHSVTQRKGGGKRLVYRYRWIEAVPLRDGEDALDVNWIGVEITDGTGKVTYRNAFITNLPVSADNVAELVGCGRARWKIENGSFNVLKNNGYHLEHNFGHGRQFLAMLFAATNLLAFAFHTVCDSLDARWQKARAAKGSRRRFFTHLHTVTAYLVFPSWAVFLETLITSKPPPDLSIAMTT